VDILAAEAVIAEDDVQDARDRVHIRRLVLNNTQPQINMANQNTASFIIPQPWDKSSPAFDNKTASSLSRFFCHIKQIHTGAKIVDDDEKKALATNYIQEDDTRMEWEGLEEKEDTQTGSLSRLRAICETHDGLGKGDVGKVKRFSLAFSNEAKKLVSEPAIITNRELVEMLVGTLEDEASTMINQGELCTQHRM
jgi:hypothetical protein